MFNKTNSVLDDIKIEVRYLSVTLLDFKEHTENENESRDRKYEKLERYFNNTIEELKDENVRNELNLTNNKVLIQNLEDSQSEIRGTFKGIYIRSLSHKNIGLCLHWLKKPNEESLYMVLIVSMMPEHLFDKNFTRKQKTIVGRNR